MNQHGKYRVVQLSVDAVRGILLLHVLQKLKIIIISSDDAGDATDDDALTDDALKLITQTSRQVKCKKLSQGRS